MSEPQVVYSIDARLGGSGIGGLAYQAALGIMHEGWLARLFVNHNAQTIIPRMQIRSLGLPGRTLKYLGAKDSTGFVYYLEGAAFDLWVAAQLPHANIFHGWNGMCLHSVRRAKEHGMITVVERASSHPATQMQLLREEYARWHVPVTLPRWNYQRALDEIHETDYITIPSEFVRQSMLAQGIPPQKLIEIPFGVDAPNSLPPASDTPRPFRVIFTGQVSIRKGIPYLLEAWQTLRWNDAELWVVGDLAHDFKPLQPQWQSVANVRYIPFTNNLYALLNQCDVFAFPSIEEGSALVTYMAMACGLPMVVTLNAGSVVRHGIEGLIVPIRNVDALCDALQQMRDDHTLRIHSGRAARERVSEFTWQHYRDRLLAAYRRIAP